MIDLRGVPSAIKMARHLGDRLAEEDLFTMRAAEQSWNDGQQERLHEEMSDTVKQGLFIGVAGVSVMGLNQIRKNRQDGPGTRRVS